MPRPRKLNPSFCHDRWSGRAYVTIAGKKYDLGPFTAPESHDKYLRLVAEWASAGRPATFSPKSAGRITVSTIIALWLAHARKHYGQPDAGGDGRGDGKRPKGELANYFDMLHHLRRLYGDTPAEEFGPKRLKALRDEMARDRVVSDPKTKERTTRPGMCRHVVNRHVGRAKAIFKWAVAEELLAGEVLHRLQAVEGLRKGQARDTRPVAPVERADVAAIFPHLPNRHLRAMVAVQLYTGMRPGELCAMRWREIDMSGDCWVYRPSSHKTEHHDQDRTIAIGPRAQRRIRRFLSLDLNAHVFSAAAAEAERRARLTAARRTPAGRGNAPGTNRKTSPAWRAGDRFTVAAYRRAIRRACEAAFPPPGELARRPGETETAWRGRLTPEQWRQCLRWWRENAWHPHQLRHTRATEVRASDGLDASGAVLGHAKLDTTQVYAERNRALAVRVAMATG